MSFGEVFILNLGGIEDRKLICVLCLITGGKCAL